MASFQAKIDWKRTRKGENKNCLSVPFRSYPTRNINVQKQRKEIKKIPLWLYFKPKQDGKGRERGKIKIIVPFRTNPMRNRKFQKKRKKIKKIPLWLHLMPKQVGKCRERENIKIVFRFPSDRIGNRKF